MNIAESTVEDAALAFDCRGISSPTGEFTGHFSTIRNAMVPKLLSGEIRTGDACKFMENFLENTRT